MYMYIYNDSMWPVLKTDLLRHASVRVICLVHARRDERRRRGFLVYGC